MAIKTIKGLTIIILSAIVLVGFVRFVELIPTIAGILIGAIFLVNIVYPATRWINRWLPLWLSIAIVYVVVIAAFIIALGYLVPTLVANVRQAVHDAPAYLASLQSQIRNPKDPVFSRLPMSARHYLVQLPTHVAAIVTSDGQYIASQVLTVAVAAVGILALVVVIPVVTLYIVLDLDNIYGSFLKVIPAQHRTRVAKIVMQCNTAIGGFIRGQLLVAAIVGVLSIGLLELLHVRYPILIGVAVGIFEVIPYLGAIVGGTIAVLVALLANGPWSSLYVLVGFVLINQLEGHIIYPLVVSESVGLSPLVVIVALLTGGELFGLPGLIIAIPLAGLLKVLVAEFLPDQEPVELAPTLRRGRRLAAVSAAKVKIEKRAAKEEQKENPPHLE